MKFVLFLCEEENYISNVTSTETKNALVKDYRIL